MTRTGAAETTELDNAAFGDDPGRWPLPAATTPHGLWSRAVAAGGQGRYDSAVADLATLRRIVSSGTLASLAHSTQGSFLRQVGWHTLARRWDGQAWALATGGGDPEAGGDALIGLAADALGVGRFAASARLLERAQALLADHAPESVPRRMPLRLAWVTAELAMVRGDGTAAVRNAERAVELARTSGSARHTVKTDVILAAALCSAGRLERARAVADDALQVTGRLGLTPLRWALACLLAEIGSAVHSAAEVVDLRDMCADTVRLGGGVWSDR
jgi:hypothetical protein